MSTTTKKTRIIYWTSTGILALFIIPGFFFAGSEMALKGTAHLGLPLWFHWELSIAKFIGGLVLILPFFPKRLKEWAYVGLGIDFISAFIAILAVDGAGGMWYSPIVCFVFLVLSYTTFHQLWADKKY
ncbi:DoxX family protein [Pedobacter sp. AW31-3R]|uniref:DoxX family protein n=1 Tax=Pedobacter sp. AW31-3R TaxID=3445781 RepID=UPI003F9ED56A